MNVEYHHQEQTTRINDTHRSRRCLTDDDVHSNRGLDEPTVPPREKETKNFKQERTKNNEQTPDYNSNVQPYHDGLNSIYPTNNNNQTHVLSSCMECFSCDTNISKFPLKQSNTNATHHDKAQFVQSAQSQEEENNNNVEEDIDSIADQKKVILEAFNDELSFSEFLVAAGNDNCSDLTSVGSQVKSTPPPISVTNSSLQNNNQEPSLITSAGKQDNHHEHPKSTPGAVAVGGLGGSLHSDAHTVWPIEENDTSLLDHPGDLEHHLVNVNDCESPTDNTENNIINAVLVVEDPEEERGVTPSLLTTTNNTNSAMEPALEQTNMLYVKATAWPDQQVRNRRILIVMIFLLLCGIIAGMAIAIIMTSDDDNDNQERTFGPSATSPTATSTPSSTSEEPTNHPTNVCSSTFLFTTTSSMTAPSTLPSTSDTWKSTLPPTKSWTSYWCQLGMNDILGEDSGDEFGRSISLSANGTIVAIGGRFNDNENGIHAGHVRVLRYSLEMDDWIQLGQDIDGQGDHLQTGQSVALSREGTVVAISSNGNIHGDNTGSNVTGCVRVFRYENNESWEQIGQDMKEEYVYRSTPFSPTHVSLSGMDGNIVVAIGNAEGDNGGGTHAGHVRVYNYSSNNDQFYQLGRDVVGFDDFDGFGFSVSLDNTARILAVGAYQFKPTSETSNSPGYASVFEWNMETNLWEKHGNNSDLIGAQGGDHFGASVSLSGDGSVLAVGGDHNDDNGLNSGHVKTYKYASDRSEWNKLGQDILGENEGDVCGLGISLSYEGTILAVGSHNYDFIYNHNENKKKNSGQVRIYQLQYSTEDDTYLWSPLGQDLLGEDSMGRFGLSLSLSDTGTVLAVGNPAIDTDSSSLRVGSVHMYGLQ